MEPLKTYAGNILSHSCSVRQGDNVMIFAEGLEAKPLAVELVDGAYALGANPFVELVDTEIQLHVLRRCNAGQMETLGDYLLEKIRRMDVLIVVSALESPFVYHKVPAEKMSLFNRNFMQRCFFGHAVMNTRWIYLKYPTRSMALLSGMDQPSFEDYYFSVCNLDYSGMSRKMDALVERMSRTDRVRIVGPGTDLSFSIKGVPTVKSDGKNGLPDGEVFTAPVKDSVQGTISFNVPLFMRGTLHENIRLVVEGGRIVDATSSDTPELTRILDTDEGSRYFGEFAFGLNPHITSPMKDILFDEKMGGSIHMAVGNSYAMTDNGNHSVVHMDVVSLQTPGHGGGEVYLDDVLVRKDGRFVDASLAALDALD